MFFLHKITNHNFQITNKYQKAKSNIQTVCQGLCFVLEFEYLQNLNLFDFCSFVI